MNLHTYTSTANMTHEQWLESRRRGIGGSDAGAIAGLNPYKSAISVYLDKTGEAPEQPDNEAMRQGRDLEGYVAQRFSESTGLKVQRKNAILVHPEHDFILANVDRLIVGKNEGLECKTTSPFNAKLYESGKIPPHYELQCMHYMAVTGADAWYLAVLVLNKAFHVFRVERDEDMIRDLVQIECDFWNTYVLKKELPPPDGSPEAAAVIAHMYPDSRPNYSVELLGLDEQLRRHADLGELIKRAEREQNQIKQSIQMELGDAEQGRSDHFVVNWKGVKSNRLDTKLLKEQRPDIYSEYSKTSTSRRFEIKEIIA